MGTPRGLPRCDVCGGRGRVADKIAAGGLLCVACEGTGSAMAMRLLRAYRLGLGDGHDNALAALGGGEATHRGLMEIWAEAHRPLTDDEEDLRE